jgi:hypothetical protein
MLLNKTSLVSEQISNNLKSQTLRLREKQNIRLRTDVDSVLFCREWIKTRTNNTFDSTRIIGVVAATKGAEYYLPYTVPKIITQISEIGMMADIVIGLNNGFECPMMINSFTLLNDVQVIHLYTEEKVANNIPAKIFDNLMCEGQPYYLTNNKQEQYKHRIFIVHQKEGEYAAGKIRVLGDIYGSLLLKSIENGWIPPAILLTFDAESQFLVEQKFSFIEPESNGLMLIVSELQKHPEIDILGARERFAVYQKAIVNGIEVDLPNFSEEVPPVQWFLTLVHGKYSGFKWKPAVGTVGRTDVLVSLLTVISQKYPGTKNDDTHLTILAKHAGFLGEIFTNVVSTNRTPSLTDTTNDEPPQKAWIQQASRWNAGFRALELNYGEHNVQSIVSDKFPWSIFTDPIEFLRRLKGREKFNLYTVIYKFKVLVIAFFVSRNYSKINLENPDILQGNKAKAYW